jgi:MSHA pilin protein MshD
MRGHAERGMTLVELTISIVVIAIAASAVLGLLSRSVGRSADAMVMSQAVAIAEAYLEEITLKPFASPRI